MTPFQYFRRARRVPVPSADDLDRARRVLRRRDALLARVRRERVQLTRRLLAAVATGRGGLTVELARRLSALSIRERLLAGLDPADRGTPVPRLVLSSWMLRDSFRICTRTADEGLHFIVGIEHDGLAIGTGIALFPCAERSPVRAAGEPRATHGVSIEAAETSHRVLALLHSHPGTGPHANHPSSTDLHTHRLWETTSNLIGGIWARDGYLRWFSADKPFAVEIVGGHMERIDDRLWKLRDEFLRPPARAARAKAVVEV
ncbi:MAG: hypothetical protein IT436_16010 [Phycisphaerales bacterium]|nr:hypothetical protein [Phycisphaerales bacterium]